MSRIETAIRRARTERRRGAFVPFLIAGYPSPDACVQVALELCELGADVLEVGVPFSDPLADGPVIQRCSQAALAAGMTPSAALAIVGRIRASTAVPIVVMSYLNPIVQFPVPWVDAAVEHGVDGVILTDLPVDQPHSVWGAIEAAGLDPILLVAPTTPAARLATIAERARGFIYCVTRMGVTGLGMGARDDLQRRIAAIRAASSLPVLLGFGISSAADAQAAATLADGAVVGSALVDRLVEGSDPGGGARELALEIIRGLGGGADQPTG